MEHLELFLFKGCVFVVCAFDLPVQHGYSVIENFELVQVRIGGDICTHKLSHIEIFRYHFYSLVIAVYPVKAVYEQFPDHLYALYHISVIVAFRRVGKKGQR